MTTIKQPGEKDGELVNMQLLVRYAMAMLPPVYVQGYHNVRLPACK